MTKSSLLAATLACAAAAASAAPIPVEKIFSEPYGRFHQGEPGKPAILLVHGTGNGLQAWTAPAGDPLGVGDWYFDHEVTPGPIVDEHAKLPGIGIHSFGTSPQDKAAVNRKNWWDFLVKQGFTVATWSQPLPLFADAWPSAVAAYGEFLRLTGSLPVALVGYSRGGLLVRKLLLEKGAQGRVKWAVLLHTPNQGTNWGKLVSKARAAAEKLGHPKTPFPHPEVRKQYDAVIGRTLVKFIAENAKPEHAEQRAESAMIKELNAHDKKLDGVSYYTFGGSTPRILRYYVWVYTKGSAVPHRSGQGVVFHRRAEPKEVSLVSPMWDKLPNPEHFDEVTPGKGDILVTDASARLPWAKHRTLPISHQDAMFHEPLQRQVAALLH